jgi:hypothetical protein
VPLHQRNAHLKKLIADTDVQFSESVEVDGREMCAHACKVGLEGVVSKVSDSRYAARPVDLDTGPGLLALGFAPYVAASSASSRNRRCWRPGGNCAPNNRHSPGNCIGFDGPGSSCIVFSAKQEPICNFNPH